MSTLLQHTRLSAIKFYELFSNRLGEEVINNVSTISNSHNHDSEYSITLLLGIKYSGGKGTGLEDGHLYCNPSFGINKTPKYDFVNVNIEVDDFKHMR